MRTAAAIVAAEQRKGKRRSTRHKREESICGRSIKWITLKCRNYSGAVALWRPECGEGQLDVFEKDDRADNTMRVKHSEFAFKFTMKLSNFRK